MGAHVAAVGAGNEDNLEQAIARNLIAVALQDGECGASANKLFIEGVEVAASANRAIGDGALGAQKPPDIGSFQQ
jgi:hypothetical protein